MNGNTRARLRAVLLLVAGAATAVAGCGATRRSEPLRGPLSLGEQEARGQVVFMEHCHQCHPSGEAGLGPALNDKPFPTFLKRFQVRRGLGAMPSFSEEQISDQELDALMAYLSALRDHKGPQSLE